MKLIHYWERGVADTTHDLDGNPLLEITLLIKPNLEGDREQIISEVEDFLNNLLEKESEGE